MPAVKPNDAARAAARLLARGLHGVLRGLGLTFVLIVLIAAGLFGWAYKRFSPEDARRLAAEQLTALLHRETTIERLVISPRGLKVIGLRVKGHAGVGDLLSCDTALLTVRLKSLAQRRLEFDTVLLESPQISLLRDADGSWNLADLFRSSGTPNGSAALALAAAETVVENGELRVDDRLRARKYELKNLSLRVDAFDTEKSFPVETSFTTADSFAGHTVTAEVTARGRVDLAGLRWSSATATADSLRVRVAGVTLDGRASVTGFLAPRVEAQASAPTMGTPQWQGLFGKDWALTLPPAKWTLKGDFPDAGMFDADRIALETPAGSASATGVVDFAADTPTLSAEVTAVDADLARFASWWPAMAPHALSGKATLHASITGWPGRLVARDADLSVRDFAGTWGARRVEGVDGEASATEEFAKLKVTTSKGTFFAIGNEFDEIALSFALDKQTANLDRLALRWGGSRVRLRAKADLKKSPEGRTTMSEVAVSGGADKVDWMAGARLWNDIRAAISTRAATADDAEDSKPWLRTFKYSIPRNFPDTHGHLKVLQVTHPNFHCADVDLMWNVHGVTPEMDKIGGEARLSFGPGRVEDISEAQGANKFLNVVFLPFIFMHKMNKLSVFSTATAYPKSLDFRRIDGEYGAAKGVAKTRYFHVDSDQLVAYAEGDADFGRERVDMNILTRLGGYDGTLPEWWVDEKGRPAIGFRVKGDMNKPELEPRFKKIEENEIEQKVDAARAAAAKRFEALEKLQTW